VRGSYPATSRKRKHHYSIKQVGRSNNSAGVRQQQRGANDIVDNLFDTTKDNPERMKATPKRIVEHAHCIAGALASRADSEAHRDAAGGDAVWDEL
jgi:hypothetical protein